MSLSASSVTGGTRGTLTDTLCNATLWLFSAFSVLNSQMRGQQNVRCPNISFGSSSVRHSVEDIIDANAVRE